MKRYKSLLMSMGLTGLIILFLASLMLTLTYQPREPLAMQSQRSIPVTRWWDDPYPPTPTATPTITTTPTVYPPTPTLQMWPVTPVPHPIGTRIIITPQP